METASCIIEERQDFIVKKGKQKKQLKCDTDSLAGAVSQRACVYCGARVVLNPVADALHLVHGPIGCASYTWDIRGSLSSHSDMFRNSFSTDLKENHVIFGGEKRLADSIDELVAQYRPKVIFVYSTCVVGVIGDDLGAVCKAASQKHGIDVIPVESSGFVGNKAVGYRAACEALLQLISPKEGETIKKTKALNFLGDFNLGGEAWIIQNYLKEIGIDVNVVFTGDASVDQLKKAPSAALNIVQCAGSMNWLAGRMRDLFGIPFFQVSFIGTDSTVDSLRKIAAFYDDPEITRRTEALIERELARTQPEIAKYRKGLEGKKAAIYVGGAYKAISLIRQFKEVGIEVVMVGTQTGKKEDYETIDGMTNDGAIIVDDANPAELERFMVEQEADMLAGGVKERVLAYKLGVAFIDHNHDRKHALAGFEGAVNFAREVYTTACSPVWKYAKAEG